MAEIRKYEPESGEGIGRLVREALGDTIRPVTPGVQPSPDGTQAQPIPDDHAVSALPTWTTGGPTLNF